MKLQVVSKDGQIWNRFGPPRSVCGLAYQLAEMFAGLAMPELVWSCWARKRWRSRWSATGDVSTHWESGCRVGQEAHSAWAAVRAPVWRSRRWEKDFHQVTTEKSQRDDDLCPWRRPVPRGVSTPPPPTLPAGRSLLPTRSQRCPLLMKTNIVLTWKETKELLYHRVHTERII